FMPFLFTLPVMIYQKISFLQAMRQSFYLTKGRVTFVTPLMLNWSLITALTLMLIYTMGILIIAFLTKLIIPSQEVILSFFDTSFTLKNMLSSIAPTFIIMINCAFISTLYAQINHPSSLTSLSSSTSNIRHLWIQYVIIFILALLMGELISPNNLYTNHLSDEIQIIAHRASAVYVPENTLSALDYAIESGAQMAEIDIQQTLDKEIILMHDLSLKRTTGYDRKVSESTYHEIQSLEAGSWFSDVFNGEIIPTLEQALQKSKDQITLMIEIKSQPHPVDIVRQVIELIERYDMEKQCLIGAMDYRVLQAVKMINPKIQTVYITALAYGDYQDLEDVDYYSIEASFISLALIDQIHRSGKQIYTWTVNKASTMQSMISMQVDGIVTDDPILLKNQLTQTNDKYISFIANLFFNASEE
ncbi:MAG: glycerophosphodiester phosphodiesterase family protein, partial [Turicibacter sp.]|nr:glycerophosphodiester phosphodiesterase family protein [Turicibacter sp.]